VAGTLPSNGAWKPACSSELLKGPQKKDWDAKVAAALEAETAMTASGGIDLPVKINQLMNYMVELTSNVNDINSKITKLHNAANAHATAMQETERVAKVLINKEPGATGVIPIGGRRKSMRKNKGKTHRR